MEIFRKIRTLFSKTEPLAPSDSLLGTPTSVSADRRRQTRINAREGIRVLVIDDSATVCAALKRMLRSAKLEVDIGVDAENGLALLKLRRPDLIFLDIVLPGMNGFSALRLLRRDPLTRDIPVIMISGNELATEQFYGGSIGADDFMKKPFSRPEVFARIERLLDAQRVPRRLAPVRAETAAVPA